MFQKTFLSGPYQFFMGPLPPHFQCRLNCISHINKTVVSSTKRIIELSYHSCQNFQYKKSYINLFHAVVHSFLECGCLVWVPTYAVHIQSIDSIPKHL